MSKLILRISSTFLLLKQWKLDSSVALQNSSNIWFSSNLRNDRSNKNLILTHYTLLMKNNTKLEKQKVEKSMKELKTSKNLKSPRSLKTVSKNFIEKIIKQIKILNKSTTKKHRVSAILFDFSESAGTLEIFFFNFLLHL